MATKRLKTLQSLYLEKDRAALLNKLAKLKRIPKAILLREAVDDLLIKHSMLKPPKMPTPKDPST